ncbi:uncharacterized protein LOC143923368 isoform X1 [Lithobates pipiens]
MNSSLDTEESGESTEIQESTETAITQDMGEPSGTLTPRRSEGIEESGESTGIAGNQEPTDIPTTGASTDAESLKAQTGEESAPLNSQTGALVPVESSTSSDLLRWLWSYIYPGWYSYISSRLPDWQYSYIYSLLPDRQWFGSWFYSPASHTHEEEPGNEDDEGPGEKFEFIDHSEAASVSNDCKQVGINRKSFQENIDKIREIIESTFSTPSWYFGRHHTVGIFSRSSESDYEWLISELKSKPFQSSVSIVRPHHICNSKHKFREAFSQNTFGILYHTKNRGRLNIVDVTDSLYDEELKYLSERLGRENVIVVVDDLEDNGDGEKTRILECQPSIVKLAREIFLFSANDKPVMTISEITQEP